MDQSTNDSGVETINNFVPAYAPPTYSPYMYPSPTPFYYPQTPLLQTAQPAAAATIIPTTSNSAVNGTDSSDTIEGSVSGHSASPENSNKSETSEV
jgi:hypothetical protein